MTTVFRYGWFLSGEDAETFFPRSEKWVRTRNISKLQKDLDATVKTFGFLGKKSRSDRRFTLDMKVLDAGKDLFVGISLTWTGKMYSQWYEDFTWDICDKDPRINFPIRVDEVPVGLFRKDATYSNKLMCIGDYDSVQSLVEICGEGYYMANVSHDKKQVLCQK